MNPIQTLLMDWQARRWRHLFHRATQDRNAVHESAHDALSAIEALQATDTWLLLPIEAQRQISRTHGVLAGLVAGMVEEEIV